MSRRVRRKIFNYMYSTAPKVVDCYLHEHSNSSDALKVVLPNSGGSYGGGLAAAQLPMHGLGYGLPLSRLYARWAAVLKFHHHFLLPSLPGTLWVISNWQAWTGLEQTPTFTFRYSNHKQIDSTFLNVFQRISSMAVENLPVFNSVSKDKLMNIATQVGDIYLFATFQF